MEKLKKIKWLKNGGFIQVDNMSPDWINVMIKMHRKQNQIIEQQNEIIEWIDEIDKYGKIVCELEPKVISTLKEFKEEQFKQDKLREDKINEGMDKLYGNKTLDDKLWGILLEWSCKARMSNDNENRIMIGKKLEIIKKIKKLIT